MSEQKIVIQQLQSGGGYVQLIPKVDAYTKSDTLTNSTSQMFGIDNGTPEQILQYLGKYNQYWWRKRTWKGIKQKKETKTGEIVTNQSINVIYYSKDVQYMTYSGTYYAQLKDSIRWEDLYNDASIFNNRYQQRIIGQYVTFSTGISSPVYYIPEGTTMTATVSSKKWTITVSSCELITYSYVDSSQIGYVQSNSRNNYPDDGNQGDYYYYFLGVPLSNAVLLAKTGEYL